MIHIAVVEDEILYVNQLKDYLQQYEQESGNSLQVTVFTDGDEVVENYSGEYDIILMDIQMRFMDGMTAAEKIRQVDEEVIIMFITNMTQYAIRGYAVDALDYVLKPVNYFAFSQRLNKAIERMKKRQKHYISIPVRDGVQKLDVSTILYIESQGHALNYYTKQEKIFSKGKMKDVEEVLKNYGFFRSNKGYLVNMKYVEGVKNSCCVIGEEQLLISRSRKNQFMEALTNYMSEVIK